MPEPWFWPSPFFIAVVIDWAVTYPSDSDPKDIKFVLWKNGLYGMKLDMANLVPSSSPHDCAGMSNFSASLTVADKVE
jgi:hypothetical protein